LPKLKRSAFDDLVLAMKSPTNKSFGGIVVEAQVIVDSAEGEINRGFKSHSVVAVTVAEIVSGAVNPRPYGETPQWLQDTDGDKARIEASWGHVKCGHISCGPGSYYLQDASISVMDRTITTEAAAWNEVRRLCSVEPSNPPVMWQLANPWSDGIEAGDEQFLVVHKRKFLDQNLDAETGKGAENFARAIEGYQPGKTWGSHFHYLK